MAHTKATGGAKRNVNVAGKRLGIKKFAGEYVKPGNIIVRQHGTKFYPGVNTEMGKDFTIFAVSEGFVNFRQMTGYKRTQKWVDVKPQVVEEKVMKTVATKTEAPEVKESKALVKKTSAKATSKAKTAKPAK